MLWSTLWHKIGKQPLKFTQHNHVYALLHNPKTHELDRVNLELKYDTNGHPYFIQVPEKQTTKPHKSSCKR